MHYVRLGRTGLQVSRIALGCMTYGDPAWRPWTLGEAEARLHIRTAWDLGINFFDTADMYSNGVSEEITGRCLREIGHRDEIVIATKVFFPHGKGPNQGGLSRKHILDACDLSLRRLAVDSIDLYQIHRYDPATPIDETLAALDTLVRTGRVRYIGASSMAAWQLARALYTSDRSGLARFVSMQNHYNLVYREEEREMIPLCIEEGVGVIPWSPLARGFLTGSRKREDPRTTTRARSDDFADSMYFADSDFEVLDALLAVSAERNLPPAQVALAWLWSVPGITSAIIGATKVEHIRDAVAALEVRLTDQEIERLEARYEPHTILGHKQPAPRTMA